MNPKGKRIAGRWFEGVGLGLITSSIIGFSNLVSFGTLNAILFMVGGFIFIVIGAVLAD